MRTYSYPWKVSNRVGLGPYSCTLDDSAQTLQILVDSHRKTPHTVEFAQIKLPNFNDILPSGLLFDILLRSLSVGSIASSDDESGCTESYDVLCCFST